jgi:16S rRNA (cytidine1402-2'-O)-methyltransferase
MPSLYVVATPIGNLEDISLRALRILGQVKLIAAEDTRRTRKLLNAYDIHTRLTSYHEHNKLAKLDSILGRLETEDVALVSDAGMPGIADPGQELITAASLKGISVVPVPGPSAAITALAVSGLSTDRFSYIGFLPRKSGERRRLLETVVGETGSIVCLETPHRLRAALEDILMVLGDRPVAVCRQLTKLHEEVFRGTVSGALEHFGQPRGEFVLVITGKADEEKPQLTEAIAEKLAGMRRSGQTARQAVVALAGETGLSKKELYRAWLRLT